jgi:drug/metabolite transporter (DMT)-like permease
MALAAMSFWGFSYVWTKIVYLYYSPITTITFRLLFATLILGILGFAFKWIERPQSKDWWGLFLISLSEPFFYFMGESHGLDLVSSTFASLMIATIPIFSLIVARIWVNERLSTLNILGIILSFTGIAIMVFEADFTIKEPILGIALMLLAVFSAVVYSILIKRMSHKYKAATLLFYQNGFGLLLFIPFFMHYSWSEVMNTAIDFRLISSLSMLVVFATILAYFFLIKVIGKLGVSKTNVFANFVPVVTAFAAWAILPDESPTLKTAAGILIVICGIFFSQTKRIKKDNFT